MIEVLILAFVMAVGLASLSRLHVVVSKEAARSANRALAVSLAQQKLDDLRAAPNFNAICDNSGGAIPIPATDPGNVNARFRLSWDVTPACVSPPPATLPRVKNVTVTVEWTDQLDDDSISLSTVLWADDPARTAEAGGGGGGASGGPKSSYTPSTSSRVVAIAVGDTIKRETLTPVSTVSTQGYVHSQFTAYTYDSSTGVLSRREDFQTVACACRFNGTGEAYRASYPKWDDEKGTYIDVVGEKTTKIVGCVANKQGTGCDTGPNVDPDCTICCRDHHDDAGATRRYDPYRKNESTAGNHSHFYNGTVAAPPSGNYVEACRLKRIDGYWRVYQDWFMVAHNALSLTDLTNSTNEKTYADYVGNIATAYIQAYINTTSNLTNGGNATLPSLPSDLLRKGSTAISVNNGSKEFISSRGIYVDYIDNAHLEGLKKLYPNKDYLAHLPFYELDVSLVAAWSSGDGAKVRVGPTGGQGNSKDFLAGGEVQALAATPTPVTVISTIRRSNSGLTAFEAIDTGPVSDNYDNATLSAEADVNVIGTGGCALPWGGVIANGTAVTAYLTDSGTCTSEIRTCSSGTLSGSYQFATCTPTSSGQCATPWGGTVAGGATTTGYSQQSASDCTTVSRTATCTSGTLSPALAPTYIYQTCTSSPTCATTISGTRSQNADTITVKVNGGTAIACNLRDNGAKVNSRYTYDCPALTTATTGNTFVVTQTLKSNTQSTRTVTSSCGPQMADF